jgi:small nuclear ribonucleoprotein G
MDRRISLQINGNRRIVGVLKGYDVFMNIVVDEATDICTEPSQMGTVVSLNPF